MSEELKVVDLTVAVATALFESVFIIASPLLSSERETCSEMKVGAERFANLEHPLQFLCCFLKLPD